LPNGQAIDKNGVVYNVVNHPSKFGGVAAWSEYKASHIEK
jgi:hypothetical protein